jgi:hypothetical protein
VHADYAWIPWGPLAAMRDETGENPTLLGAVQAWSIRTKEPA